MPSVLSQTSLCTLPHLARYNIAGCCSQVYILISTKLTVTILNQNTSPFHNFSIVKIVPVTASHYIQVHVFVIDLLINFAFRKLDYDSISPKLYDFNVIATDNGGIPRTGEAVIRIFMINLNDETPLFQDPMTADLFYNSPVGQDVYVVQATDADIGDTVTYQFAGSMLNFLFFLMMF